MKIRGNCFVSKMRLFSIIRFDIRLLTFEKFVEFLKFSTVKAGLNVFCHQPVDMLTICLSFKKYQPMHAYKRYVVKKECVINYLIRRQSERYIMTFN